MTTKEIGMSLHEELDRRDALIKQLTEEANAIRVVLGVLERPSPEQHNRVTRVIGRRGRKKKALPPPKTRRAIDGTKRCKRCQRSAAEGAVFNKFKAFRDGLDNRCKDCRAALYQERKAGKPNGHEGSSMKHRRQLNAAGPGLVRCDQPECEGVTFDTDRGLAMHKMKVHSGSTPAKLPLVKCDECGDRFPDAKAMGIHKTRVHFGTHSERRSTLD